MVSLTNHDLTLTVEEAVEERLSSGLRRRLWAEPSRAGATNGETENVVGVFSNGEVADHAGGIVPTQRLEVQLRAA